MSARSKARKRALDVLFESEVRGLPLGSTLDERLAAGEAPPGEYATALVRGVVQHQGRIDALLAAYAQGWSLDRMPAVDRNALRIGVYEVLYADDVPDAVAVSEAMGLVRDLSTDESPAFVNGVLGTIVRDKPALSA
jgi:transcription antitermination protein NusB